MALSHEHLGSKTLAEIDIYILTRAELLCPHCYEIPCSIYSRLVLKATTNDQSFKNDALIFLCQCKVSIVNS